MAIQAQMYADSSTFPMWGGGGDGVGGGAVGLHDEMCLNLHRHQMQIQPFHSHNPNPTPSFRTQLHDSTPSFCASDAGKHDIEIDQFIVSQSEQLRQVLREQRKRQLNELLRKMDARTRLLLNQKDEEISRALNRTSHLNSLIVKLQHDNLIYQQIAKQDELHVISLQHTLNQLQNRDEEDEKWAVEDASSCCNESQEQSGLKLNGEERECKCKVCGEEEICVVVLPCRHLCCCKMCDSVIDLCPVCQTEKKGSIEALFQ